MNGVTSSLSLIVVFLCVIRKPLTAKSLLHVGIDLDAKCNEAKAQKLTYMCTGVKCALLTLLMDDGETVISLILHQLSKQ